MDDLVEAAVVRQHELLAAWLGSRAGEAVLAELRAAHSAGFTLVTVDGEVLDRDTLLAALAGAADAQPGRPSGHAMSCASSHLAGVS